MYQFHCEGRIKAKEEESTSLVIIGLMSYIFNQSDWSIPSADD